MIIFYFEINKVMRKIKRMIIEKPTRKNLTNFNDNIFFVF